MTALPEAVAREFRRMAPRADFWTLRVVAETHHGLSVRQDVVEPPATYHNFGAMLTVWDGGGIGYGATCDLSMAGLGTAFEAARSWAHTAAARALVDPSVYPRPTAQGIFRYPAEIPWDAWSLGQKMDLLRSACGALKVGASIADWHASMVHSDRESLLVSAEGGWIEQSLSTIHPSLMAVANRGAETQSRSLGRDGMRQAGLEVLERIGFVSEAPRVGEEALALLDAPPCPNGPLDVVLMPGQVVLQMHESIGHPLELDRILGDERNYAGTSFVTPDMFGSYRYGSPLLNVTFAPDVPGEVASYGFDDEGTAAERVHLIREGILERPLGGAVSQARAGLEGVANARAESWNRPPVDRMANINLEPGEQRLAELIGGVERGILMDSNRSWSIDDSRNKFQFGCEVGWLIEDGERKGMVRDPGYRGISSHFWRSLDGVGDLDTFQVMGLENCGKGEPNQKIATGHAAPACRFSQVDVFGGE